MSFGMFPILPAFAGYVPDELIVRARRSPHA